jgi:hypothetical protein
MRQGQGTPAGSCFTTLRKLPGFRELEHMNIFAWLGRLILIVMATVVAFSKLAELRARTDRDLVRILNADLERSIALAGVAATRHSVFRAQAENVYVRAKALLPKLSGLTAEELAQLEAKLKELEMALDLVPGTMDLEQHAN